MVIFLEGKSNPQFFNAALTLSLLSLTDASGKVLELNDDYMLKEEHLHEYDGPRHAPRRFVSDG